MWRPMRGGARTNAEYWSRRAAREQQRASTIAGAAEKQRVLNAAEHYAKLAKYCAEELAAPTAPADVQQN
jgi:hypothetical protein